MHFANSAKRRAYAEIACLFGPAVLVVAIGVRASLPSLGAGNHASPSTASASGTAPSAQAPAGDVAAPSQGPAALAPGEAPVPATIALKSRDGHAFGGLYASPSTSTSNAILIVPDLGQKGDHYVRLAGLLRVRGYRVLSMDNTGQLRQVARGANAMPTFTPMTTKVLGNIVQDVNTGIEGLRGQPGVGRVAILGFGIGANASLVSAGADSAVAAVAAILPSYGCEEFDPYAAFGNMNARPVLLLESRKKYNTDLSVAFEHIMAKRKDLPFEHVKLRRDPEALTQQDLEEDYEESLLAWLEKAFLPDSH